MAQARYEQARAIKKNSGREVEASSISSSSVKKSYKKIKKSPVLIIAVVFMILGALGGFFIAKSTCSFYMNEYKINGKVAEESDYIVVDMSEYKQQLENSLGINAGVTTSQVYSTMNLEDSGVTAKFLGVDITNSITIKYYYREDISHDIVEVSSVDVKTAGVYYIEYTSSHFAYKNTKLIRTIIVTEVEVDG